MTERDDSLRALEASESKLRRFVADASHELRTPLAAVRAYAELFTRGASQRPDDLERSMKGISRESERMSVLVEDLLLLAHLDEGRPLERGAGRARRRRRRGARDRPDARAGAADRGRRSRRSTVAGRPRPPPPGRRQPALERPLAHAARRARSPSTLARDERLRPCSRSRTRARGWTRSSSRTSSSASTAPTPRAPARAAAPASASRSSPPSSQAHGGERRGGVRARRGDDVPRAASARSELSRPRS